MRNELEFLDIQTQHLVPLFKNIVEMRRLLHEIYNAANLVDSAIAHRMTELSKSASVPAEPEIEPIKSGFVFGDKSEAELKGVDADLVKCVRLALVYTIQDFMVYDGIRTVKEQEAHVRNGTSKTMQSKHLVGKAVDLVPFINGIPKWDWDGCYKIALAMDQAATELGIANRITWGGAWDKTLADLNNESVGAYKRAVEEYRARHPGPDFIDGPHFEIK